MREGEAARPQTQARSMGDVGLEAETAAPDQVIADVRGAIVGRAVAGAAVAPAPPSAAWSSAAWRALSTARRATRICASPFLSASSSTAWR